LFGGLACSGWTSANITATIYSEELVTVSVCKVNFTAPVLPKMLLMVADGSKGSFKNGSMVDYQEDMYSDSRNKAVDATFIFAAVDKDNKPVRLIDSKVEPEVKCDTI
jgi:acyl-CoA hydrolase